MPAQDGFGSHEGGKLIEHLATEDLAFDGKPASLVVVEEYSFLSELLPEYPILSIGCFLLRATSRMCEFFGASSCPSLKHIYGDGIIQ
jgi:hypothetical protein